MKKVIAVGFVVLSTASFGRFNTMPVVPAPFSGEAVLVKEIIQRGNLMPGPGPARKLYTTLQVEVISNGCTRAADFKVRVNSGGSQQLMQIERIQPDLCEATPHPVTVEIETTDLALSSVQPIRVANSLLAQEHVTH